MLLSMFEQYDVMGDIALQFPMYIVTQFRLFPKSGHATNLVKWSGPFPALNSHPLYLYLSDVLNATSWKSIVQLRGHWQTEIITIEKN